MKVLNGLLLLLLLFMKVRIRESPSICSFPKNNGDEAPKGPCLHYFSGVDRYEDFLLLKIHPNKKGFVN